MKRVVLVLSCFALIWLVHDKYKKERLPDPEVQSAEERPSRPLPLQGATSPAFRCDGRKYCSQMTSCAEATYFLKNCPGTQMDGDNDGIPCERQWCK